MNKNQPLFTMIFLSLAVTSIYSSQITTMNYVVTHEVSIEEDFVEVGLELRTSDASLKLAIQQSEELVKTIAKKAEKHCTKYKTKTHKCQDIVDVGNFQIQAVYREIKGQPQFQQFVVKHEMTIGVSNVQKMGFFVDDILQNPEQVKINNFNWRPLLETNEQDKALDAGVQEGRSMCLQVGQQFHRIVSIEQIIGSDQQQAEDDEDPDAEILQFKFEIECLPPKKK